jgi:hypothetical protein
MSTILFFTSDRIAFANNSDSGINESIVLAPDMINGSRLLIGNSSMISYSEGSNINSIDESKATVAIDNLNRRIGIGIATPQASLDVAGTGLRVTGPTNLNGIFSLTGNATFNGNATLTGTITAALFSGSGGALTSIPAPRLIGSIPASAYANNTIPVSALFGVGGNGQFTFSGNLNTTTLNVTSSISTNFISTGFLRAGTIVGSLDASNLTGTLSQNLYAPRTIPTASLSLLGTITVENISSINSRANTMIANQLVASTANISSLTANDISVSTGSISTLNVYTLNVNFISSASLDRATSLEGQFSSISAATGTILRVNTNQLSTGLATISTSQINNLFANIADIRVGQFSTISSGTAWIQQLSTAILRASSVNTVTLTANNGNIVNFSTTNGWFQSMRASTIQAESLSSFIVNASSMTTPNLYVTNIYANGGDTNIVNVIASTLNSSRAVFLQVIASSFQGSLVGKNIIEVETY